MSDTQVLDEKNTATKAEESGNTGTEGETIRSIQAVYQVPVKISAVLGRAMMPVNQLLKLARGSVVELDRRVGEAVDVYVNDRLVAKGEVVIIDDRLGITMTEIVRGD